MKIFNSSCLYAINYRLSMSFLIFMIAAAFPACREAVKEENNTDKTASAVSPADIGDGNYIIDTNESEVTWKGSMLIGTNSHTGYVYISKGILMVNNGRLTAGNLEVDMNTIEDESHRSDNSLIDHLKDPDFFDVKKFPLSTFSITRVTSINGEDKQVTGNLTIKSITQPVSFPAKMEVTDAMVKANGKLVIDRTKWDIRYKSGKFYDLLADQTMSDSIEFHINIVAKNK